MAHPAITQPNPLRFLILVLVSDGTTGAYALQQTKLIILCKSIRKPEALGSNSIVAYGFLNLISLFEKLTVELYDWIFSGHEDASSGIAITSSIQFSLRKPLSLDGILETHQVDILITQQRLQVRFWRLAVNRSLPKLSGSQGTLPF